MLFAITGKGGQIVGVERFGRLAQYIEFIQYLSLQGRQVNPSHTIPLFPLGLVLLPGMSLPLHIFEERYKQMTSECLSDDRPFGIVKYDGKAIGNAGCTARITSVTKRYDDGRTDILVRGENRFVVQSIIDEKPYLEGAILFFDDVETCTDKTLDDTVLTARGLLRELNDLNAFPDADRLSTRAGAGEMSFAVPALDGFTPKERQSFLEMTSCPERLKKAVETLSHVVRRYKLTTEIQSLIGGNGHLRRELAKMVEEGLGKAE